MGGGRGCPGCGPPVPPACRGGGVPSVCGEACCWPSNSLHASRRACRGSGCRICLPPADPPSLLHASRRACLRGNQLISPADGEADKCLAVLVPDPQQGQSLTQHCMILILRNHQQQAFAASRNSTRMAASASSYTLAWLPPGFCHAAVGAHQPVCASGRAAGSFRLSWRPAPWRRCHRRGARGWWVSPTWAASPQADQPPRCQRSSFPDWGRASPCCCDAQGATMEGGAGGCRGG